MRCQPFFVRAAAFGLFGLFTSPAFGTLSILAVDTGRGEVGAAVVSCVGDTFDLSEVVALDDEVGGVIAQSYFFQAGRDEILARLRAGDSPESAIQRALDPSIDPPEEGTGPTYRQYAALLLDGRGATATGDDALPSADAMVVTSAPFVLTVQGNIMVNVDLLEVLRDGFEGAEGDLGRRLAEAMRALGEGGAGDARCTPRTSDAGYFQIHSRRFVEPISQSLVSSDEDAALLLADAIAQAMQVPSDEPDALPDEGPGRSKGGGCGVHASSKNGAATLVFGCLGGIAWVRRKRATRAWRASSNAP